MTADPTLEARVRAVLAGGPTVTERRMFGGLAFLVEGRMAVAVSAAGVMIRLPRPEAEEAIAAGSADPVEMRGRTMREWVRVPSGRLADDGELGAWVARGVRDALARE